MRVDSFREDHGSRGIGYALQLGLIRGPELLGREGQLGGEHVLPGWHRDIGESGRDPLPEAGSVFVKALAHVFGQAKLPGGSGGRDGTIDERQLQPAGQSTTHPVAARTIRRRKRHHSSHGPIPAHWESIRGAEPGGAPGGFARRAPWTPRRC